MFVEQSNDTKRLVMLSTLGLAVIVTEIDYRIALTFRNSHDKERRAHSLLQSITNCSDRLINIVHKTYVCTGIKPIIISSNVIPK